MGVDTGQGAKPCDVMEKEIEDEGGAKGGRERGRETEGEGQLPVPEGGVQQIS